MINYILPSGGQFNAVINGKPTGLAGCTRAQECAQAQRCIRADGRLQHRADMSYQQPTADCRAFIPINA